MAYLHSDAKFARVLSLKGDDAPVRGRAEANACKVDRLIASSRPHLVAGIPWVGLEASVVDLQVWVQGPVHAAGHWIIHHHAYHLHSMHSVKARLDRTRCVRHQGTGLTTLNAMWVVREKSGAAKVNKASQYLNHAGPYQRRVFNYHIRHLAAVEGRRWHCYM